jgi:hypothetical protein
MRLTEADKLQAYTLAMHQLIGAMANVQSIIRLAKRGEINLMDPEWLDQLDHTANGERTKASMDPITTYAKRLRKEAVLGPVVVSELLGTHRRESITPFEQQGALIVDCSCGQTYVVPARGDEYGTLELAQRNHVGGVTFEPGRHGETYWLRATESGFYSQVSLEQWCQAERGAGFHPKPGCGPTATGGFSSGGLSGTAQYPETVLRLWEREQGGSE